MSTIKSDVLFTIELDQNKIPETIHWTAKDGGIENEETKSIMLSVWDSKTKESLRMDLWTKDMPVDEMKLFFHQNFVAMADTFHRATGDDKMADTMRDFASYFAEKMELLK
jgi:gliding motility-associated protein GldC